jgi:adenosine deaminase
MMSTTFHRVPTVAMPQTVRKPTLPPAASSVSFGAQENAYAASKRIDDNIYALLAEAPKNELHVHQGGSSSVAFLNHCLRGAIDRGEITCLPLYQPGKAPINVPFKTTNTGQEQLLSPRQLRAAKERVLTGENLRTYYRYQLQLDNHQPYMNTEDLAETTATHQPEDRFISVSDPEQLKKQKKGGLNAYRLRSGKINPFVKNSPAAYYLAYDYARSLALENVQYTEYRVSPAGNGIGGNNGSNIEDVLSNVHAGFEDALKELRQSNHKMDYGLLVLFERQNRSDDTDPNAKIRRAVQLAQDVVRLKREGKYNIVGVDLAGDEAHNPVTEFKPAFDIIKAYNKTAKPENRLGITIHAGETANSGNLSGAQSIEQAIAIAHDPNTPVRIGHGVQIINSSDALRDAFNMYLQHPTDWEQRIDKADLLRRSPLLKQVIDNHIVLEMCPKSNLQTYAIHPGFPNDRFEVWQSKYSEEGYRHHPAVFLSRLGVKVTLSSDNRTISNTDVTNEYVKLFKYAGLTYKDFKQMVMNGFEGAFISDRKKKDALLADVRNQFGKLECSPEHIQSIQKMKGSLSSYQQWVLLKATVRQTLNDFFTGFQSLVGRLLDWWHERSGTPHRSQSAT